MRPTSAPRSATLAIALAALPACSSSASDEAPAPLADAPAEPIVAPERTWTWIPIEGAVCRDGSPTGIGVSLAPGSDKVAIYLEGGGACFNPALCLVNPSTFGATDFAAWADHGGGRGIFDRTRAENPLRDWSQVYVPYCTGDVHAGAAPDGLPHGGNTPQQFVGYTNIGRYLRRLVPTFPRASQVLLTGASAGGFGAAINYDRVARAFPSARVDLLDDSGPAMAASYLAPCLQQQWRDIWALDATMLADCGADCPSHDDFVLDFMRHLAKTHPGARQGLVESMQDAVIRFFFAFGEDDCRPDGLEPMDPDRFAAGLLDARAALAGAPTFGTFYFDGTDHTTIGGGSFYTRTAGNTALAAWTAKLVSDASETVGP